MTDNLLKEIFSFLIEKQDYLVNLEKRINLPHILSLIAFFVIMLLVGGGLLLLNESVSEYYRKERLRSHTLHIHNQGNVPSVFLLRTIDLADQFAIRFRINHEPMIWVTHKEKPKPEDNQPKVESQDSAEAEVPVQKRQVGLIPDLNRPGIEQQTEETVTKAFKTAENVGKKAGLLASILSSLSYLVGGTSSGVKNAVSALKDVQQSVNDTISGTNAAIGQAEALKRQVNSFTGASGNPLETHSETVQNGAKELSPQETGLEVPEEHEEIITSENFSDLFTYDEETWEKNIYAKDPDGGALIYAQSKVLAPGESMDISLEIMNLSRHDISARSLLYQIEVVQIPQTPLAISSIRHRIHGVVIFPKISLKTQFMPFLIMTAAVLLSVFLLLRCSYVFLYF